MLVCMTNSNSNDECHLNWWLFTVCIILCSWDYIWLSWAVSSARHSSVRFRVQPWYQDTHSQCSNSTLSQNIPLYLLWPLYLQVLSDWNADDASMLSSLLHQILKQFVGYSAKVVGKHQRLQFELHTLEESEEYHAVEVFVVPKEEVSIYVLVYSLFTNMYRGIIIVVFKHGWLCL